jgi:hypothetical protein
MYGAGHRVYTEWQWLLSGVHSIMKGKIIPVNQYPTLRVSQLTEAGRVRGVGMGVNLFMLVVNEV